MNAMPSTPAPAVLPLTDPRATDPGLTGGKAARLAAALQAGHPVPPGFVLTTAAFASDDPYAGLEAALDALGGVVAVRSSGVAEDLEGASFAGQYETVLDVRGAGAVLDAVQRCLRSASSERVRAYRESKGLGPAPMAVLVQRFVPARAAGVAFTAHPVTGERGVVGISAVRGVGEALVSGTSDAEEWEVRETPVRRRSVNPVLTAEEVARVAALARAVEDGPTDIEWALHDGELHLLQARPMTAVPDEVRWDAPLPGGWVRNFRLGEWIGAPVTPLFESWYLTGVERRMHDEFDELFGVTTDGPLHVLVNGWYFYGPRVPRSTLGSAWRILRNLPGQWRRMCAVTPPLAHLGFDAETERWRETLLPAWRDTVAEAERDVGVVGVAELPDLVQRLVDHSGAQLASIVGVAGYAAKAEAALIAFLRKHDVDAGANELIVGAEVTPSAHDVEGLDWVFPTLGERGEVPAGPSTQRRGEAVARRDAAEARVRDALPASSRPAFARLVAEARRAHAIRVEQTAHFTRGHPVLRRALGRLGASLAAGGWLAGPEDVWFLTRAELDAALRGQAAPDVGGRRARWERQRRLAPPLVVGEFEGLFKKVFTEIDRLLHHPEHDEVDALPGMPGSPGRVSGPARVVRSVEELDRLQPGEVLVAPVTTPLWTLAFGRALAVVTDTGSVASHASIVAREYGIPAVVGTATATARIVDGQRITVDGSRGVVRLGG